MKKLIIGLMAIAALSACSSLTRDKLGISKKAPNEQLVTTRKPLSVPPEYDLRPVTDESATEENI